MDVSSLIGSALVGSEDPSRDSWSLGTVSSAPSGGKVQVTLDGDAAPVAMNYCVPLSVGDRVLTLLLGRARLAVAVIVAG